MLTPMKFGASMRLFPRENYLNKIRGFYHDDGMTKVITGVRRCGKSCLMRRIAEELRTEGIDEARLRRGGNPEIFEKDICKRVEIKNVSMFNQVRDYVISNFGTTTSLANIKSDLESKQGAKVKRETLARRVARSVSDASESWSAISS